VSRWPNKYVIGLTGNIAVGKTVVRQMVQHLGAYTIDADGLSHQAMQPGAPAYKPVVQTFGQFILGPDQRINRAMLGQIVFSNPDALAKLEAIVHPIVGMAVGTLVKRAKQRVVVIEAIKLLEGDLADAVDTVWVVNASPETQIKRLVEKRKMGEADARQRVTVQNAQSDKLAKANVVIQNDGNVEETWKQVQDAWGQVRTTLMGQAGPAPQPQQAAPAASAPVAEGPLTVEVKRGMPGNAEDIARFISETTGKAISRMDIMMAFGQKSYLLAKDGAANDIGLMGWQVENLITRTDEFYLKGNVPPAPVIDALLAAVEEASMDLQSEVSFIFLPSSSGEALVQPFLKHGYELTTVKEIKIPAWREAVQEIVSSGDGEYQILSKKLREDRVLQPL
jgi:dephospho-CoA kinase